MSTDKKYAYTEHWKYKRVCILLRKKEGNEDFKDFYLNSLINGVATFTVENQGEIFDIIKNKIIPVTVEKDHYSIEYHDYEIPLEMFEELGLEYKFICDIKGIPSEMTIEELYEMQAEEEKGYAMYEEDWIECTDENTSSDFNKTWTEDGKVHHQFVEIYFRVNRRYIDKNPEGGFRIVEGCNLQQIPVGMDEKGVIRFEQKCPNLFLESGFVPDDYVDGKYIYLVPLERLKVLARDLKIYYTYTVNQNQVSREEITPDELLKRFVKPPMQKDTCEETFNINKAFDGKNNLLFSFGKTPEIQYGRLLNIRAGVAEIVFPPNRADIGLSKEYQKIAKEFKPYKIIHRSYYPDTYFYKIPTKAFAELGIEYNLVYQYALGNQAFGKKLKFEDL